MDRSLLALMNAVRNGSSIEATPDMVLAALRGEGGEPSHLRAVFGDVALDGLERAGAAHGIALDTILDAYEHAKSAVWAANPELDAALADRLLPHGSRYA